MRGNGPPPARRRRREDSLSSVAMAGRTTLSEVQEGAVRAALVHFSYRDRLLVLMGLHTGFRIHELLSITVAQVWDGGRVRAQLQVARGRMKGGSGERRRAVCSRTVPLHPVVVGALQDYLEDRAYEGTCRPDALLFQSRQGGAALGRLQANRILEAVFARAGLRGAGVWGSHSLRKTFARRVYDKSGHDLELTRAALGHRNIGTTQRYLATSQEAAAAAILAL